MPKYNIDFSDNPSFNTVLGLSNTTFNPNNIVSGRMVTEQQLQDTWQRIYDDEQLIDRCCRDIILWEAHVQVVRLNTDILTGTSPNKYYSSGGVVVSDFDENVTVGIMRRGMKYTITFPLKWDRNTYVTHTAEVDTSTGCNPLRYTNDLQKYSQVVQYRYVEGQNKIEVSNCTSSTNNRANFIKGQNGDTQTGTARVVGGGILINGSVDSDLSQNWGSFTLDIKDDGTVNLTDNRRNTNFDIIKFYTQWTLRRCSDGTMLSDPPYEV